ncbi:HAD superfamily hydrolase (TIGR01509 family) [Saccharopolyspora lacisalsi]|uniref:HAD superfamily hydrolase (TIGR01509 family) n=1 Tax=Halosaccharopolyspora lacisalsi TaxID=1000566 RepID=A0A839DY36_9PSEU|nr:HAD family phosphatase [Halosaccharopolyspora lacisalsi]MBA8823668.1 HAD superfamily hydrolase (TIGR01509 family) [Halosaccharopolyspora lacisalsi]
MTETRADPARGEPSGTGPAAVLFDMDGTLVDSEKLWKISLDDYAAYRGGAISAPTRALMVGSNMERSMGLLLRDLELLSGPSEVEAAAQWVAGRTAELFRQGLSWRPGARRLLRGLRDRGVPTALVTSTIRPLTKIALDTLGHDSFDATVCGDEVEGRNKPHPEPYLRACRMLGVDPGECVAVEDSPTGVNSAVDAGCTVVGVPCEVPLEPGERRVLCDSLEQLDGALLAEVLAGGRLP